MKMKLNTVIIYLKLVTHCIVFVTLYCHILSLVIGKAYDLQSVNLRRRQDDDLVHFVGTSVPRLSILT